MLLINPRLFKSNTVSAGKKIVLNATLSTINDFSCGGIPIKYATCMKARYHVAITGIKRG
jgi:hypothetical protein